MLVYENTKDGFLQDVFHGQIVDEIKDSYAKRGLTVGSRSEVRSWRNSLSHMESVLKGSDIPDDAGIAIEFKIPLTSRRIDFLISGHGNDGKPNVFIIELKQWTSNSTKAINGTDGTVRAIFGGTWQETTHPSYQAWSYYNFIRDLNLTVREGQIDIYPLAYLHNFSNSQRDILDNEIYQNYTQKAPIYFEQDAPRLRNKLEEYLKQGDNKTNIHHINDGKIKPSKSLQNSLLGMLESHDEFTLIEKQKVVFEKAVRLGKRSSKDDQKRVFIVEGGPGTGKTVVAINILAELIDNGLMAKYVSKNSTPRQVYKEKLKSKKSTTEIRELFTGSGSFYEETQDTYPALIADEAHRLNEESGFYGNQGENQIMEIINASKFSVFFIDESQRVHIDDIGSKDEIKKYANNMGAEIHEMELESQFRCNGSKGYIAWLDDVLEIRDTANANEFDYDYDLQIFDSPEKMHQAIREKNSESRLARVVAGYCWDWNTDERDNPDYYDITIGEYEKSWNLDDSSRPHWAIDAGSLEEVGCIHTCQGLEFDYVGVILGPDIKYRDSKIKVDFEERYSHDSSIRGLKKMYRENPKEAERLEEEIIKNTYRTLMSRGMKGCYVYCCDDELQNYFQTQIENVETGSQ